MAVFKNELNLDAKQHNREMKNAAESARDYDRKIRDVERDTRKLLAQQKRQMMEAAKLRREYKQLGDTMLNAFGGGIGANIGAFTSKLGAVAVVASAAAISLRNNAKIAKEFELSMSRLSSITGASGKDLEFYKQAAIELGSTTTQSASQVAQSFAIIGSKSPELLKAKEALVEVTKYAITLAEAANMTVDEAATALTGILNQFGLNANKSKDIINMLAAASKEGAGDINYLNSAIVNCGSVAKSMNISVDKTIAIIEQLAQAGLDSSTAGNNLKNIFLALETSADKNLRPSVVGIVQALENLKNKGLDTTEMVKLFGKENIAAATIILNSTEKIKEMNTAIQGTNTAEEQARTNTDNLDGSIKNLDSAWEGLNLTINSSNGNLKTFVDWCTMAIIAANEFLKKSNEINKARNEGKNGVGKDEQYTYLPFNYKGVDYDLGKELENWKKRYKGSTRGRAREELDKEFDKRFAELLPLMEEHARKNGSYGKQHLEQLKQMRNEYKKYIKELESEEYKQRVLAQNPVTPTNTPDKPDTPDTPKTTTPKAKTDNKEKFDVGSLQDYEKRLRELQEMRASQNLTEEQVTALDKQIAQMEIKVRDTKIYLKILPEIDYSQLDNRQLEDLEILYVRADDDRRNEVSKARNYNDIKENLSQYKLPDVEGNYESFEADSKALTGYIDLLKTLIEVYKQIPEYQTILNTKLVEAEDKLNKLNNAYNDESITKYKKAINEMVESQDSYIDSIGRVGEDVGGILDAWGRLADVMSDEDANPLMKIGAFADAIGQTINQVLNLTRAIDTIRSSMEAYQAAQLAASAASKAAAVGEIAANEGKAISGAAASGAKLPFPANLAAIAASVAAVLSVIGMIGKFANGGIVQGSSTVGDYNLARVNGGEMILNNRQQAHLWNLINSNNSANSNNLISNGSVEFKIKGKELVGVLNNYNKQQSKI